VRATVAAAPAVAGVCGKPTRGKITPAGRRSKSATIRRVGSGGVALV